MLVATVMWSQPLFSAVANAQFGAVVFGLLAVLSYGVERGRAGLTAASWTALLIKPHLSALVLLGTLLLDRGRWRGYAIATGFAVTVASLVALPPWQIEYVRAVVDQRLDVDPGLASFATLAGAKALTQLPRVHVLICPFMGSTGVFRYTGDGWLEALGRPLCPPR